jgi:hypothetical protein
MLQRAPQWPGAAMSLPIEVEQMHLLVKVLLQFLYLSAKCVPSCSISWPFNMTFSLV